MTREELVDAIVSGFNQGTNFWVELAPIVDRIGLPLVCTYPDHDHSHVL